MSKTRKKAQMATVGISSLKTNATAMLSLFENFSRYSVNVLVLRPMKHYLSPVPTAFLVVVFPLRWLPLIHPAQLASQSTQPTSIPHRRHSQSRSG